MRSKVVAKIVVRTRNTLRSFDAVAWSLACVTRLPHVARVVQATPLPKKTAQEFEPRSAASSDTESDDERGSGRRRFRRARANESHV